MKSLKSILEASILADIDDQLEAGDEAIKLQIKDFIKQNFDCKIKISDEPNKDGKYEVSALESIKPITRSSVTSLTNGLFVWADVKGDVLLQSCINLTSLEGAPKYVKEGNFNCCSCYKLKSLIGAPKEVGGNFDCNSCDSLTTLEGCPEKVGGSFYCSWCENLKSLKGAPKEVGGTFSCKYCDGLTSLEGATQRVGLSFVCDWCKNLKSLKGAPKEVGGTFSCSSSKVKFTEKDVNKVSNVKGKISC